jgi:hypothetical protein
LIDQLRDAIRDSGIGIRELGRMAEIDPSRISRFMRGERSIDVIAASAICQALGYGLAKLDPAKPRPRRAKRGPALGDN